MDNEAKKKNTGQIISIVVILVILVVGAIYIWGGKVVQAPKTDTAQQETPEQIIDQTTQDLSDVDLNIDLDTNNI